MSKHTLTGFVLTKTNALKCNNSRMDARYLTHVQLSCTPVYAHQELASMYKTT